MASIRNLLSRPGWSVWGREVMASFVVFLVALPLCMGISIASGVPPALGLLTGIIGGIVVGSLAGAPLQVSGPAAGLTVLVWQLVQEHGLVALGVAVLAGGVLQAMAGMFRLGRWFRAVSPALIQGMLAGIGVLIFVSQFHVMVDDQPGGSGLDNLLTIPSAVKKGLIPMDTSSHHLAALVGVITVASIVAWNRLRPRRLEAVPGTLVAVVIGAAVANLAGMNIQFVAVPTNLAASLNIPTLAAWGKLADPAFLSEAFALALIASAETLLCAAAVSRMSAATTVDYDRELTAQGVGNMLCGLVGALPMTGVIVRSSANVEAGARTRVSAILHGVWLLGLVVALPGLLHLVPTASLAAILVYTGYKLMRPGQVRELCAAGKGEAVVFGVTVAGILVTDLLTGVLLGLGAALAKLIYTFSHLEVERLQAREDRRVDLVLRGAATFVRLPVLAEALERIDPRTEVHVHVGELSYIDHACMELLDGWRSQHERGGGSLVIEWDALRARAARLVLAASPVPEPLPRAASSRPVVVGA